MPEGLPAAYVGPNSAVIQGDTKHEVIKSSEFVALEDWR